MLRGMESKYHNFIVAFSKDDLWTSSNDGIRNQEQGDPGWCLVQSMIIACQVRRMMEVVSKAGTGT